MVFSKLTLPLAGLLAIIDRANAQIMNDIMEMGPEDQKHIACHRACLTAAFRGDMIAAHSAGSTVDSNSASVSMVAASAFEDEIGGMGFPGGAGGLGRRRLQADEHGECLHHCLEDEGAIHPIQLDDQAGEVALKGLTYGGFGGKCAFDNLNNGCADLSGFPLGWQYSYTGRCNSPVNPFWGMAGETMTRVTDGSAGTNGGNSSDNTSGQCSSCYTTGTSLSSADIATIRGVSDKLCMVGATDQDKDGGNMINPDKYRSDATITWAQLMDHDVDATNPHADKDTAFNECMFEGGGTAFDEGTVYSLDSAGSGSSGSAVLGMKQARSCEVVKNVITSYIDAGILYGESICERNALFDCNNGFSCQGSGIALHSTSNESGIYSNYLPTNMEMKGCAGAPGQCDSEDSGVGMANPTGRSCFFAGDFRAGENPALTAYHTMFLRLHNLKIGDGLNFEEARREVISEEQHITYNEWLPAYTGALSRFYKFSNTIQEFTGASVLPPYSFSSAQRIRPSARMQFATGTYRQHTGVSGTMMMQNGRQLELDQSFFESCVWFKNGPNMPGCASQSGFTDDLSTPDTDEADNNNDNATADTDLPDQSTFVFSLCNIIAGQHMQPMREGTTHMITEQRNQLFYKKDFYGNTKADGSTNDNLGSQGWEGFSHLDLASLNIFRGRDHLLAKYTSFSSAFFGHTGWPADYCGADAGCESVIIASSSVAFAYASASSVDLWIGALAEKKIRNNAGVPSALGSVLTRDVVTQFRDLRDGDRFFNASGHGLAKVLGQTAGVECEFKGDNPFLYEASCICPEEGTGGITSPSSPYSSGGKCGSA